MKVQDRTSFERAMQHFPDGLVSVTVEVTTEKAFRSLQANRFMWAVFTAMANQAGVSKEDMHDLMCDRFLKHRVDIVDRESGEITEHDVTRGTSRLKPKEHAEFMDRVIQFAGEWLGLEIERESAA